MPSEHSPGGSTDRTRYTDLKARFGEDPARWLDRDVLADDGVSMAADRIRGIDHIGLVNAWKQVERDLGRGEDGGPRTGVMQRLDERLQHLIQHGERPDDDTLREIAQAVRAEYPEWDETTDVELPSWEERMGTTAGVRSASTTTNKETTEASGLDDFVAATDGGENA